MVFFHFWVDVNLSDFFMTLLDSLTRTSRFPCLIEGYICLIYCTSSVAWTKKGEERKRKRVRKGKVSSISSRDEYLSCFVIDTRSFHLLQTLSGEKRFRMMKRCSISFVSNEPRMHSGWPKFFPWPCHRSTRHRETSTDCKSGVSYRRVSIKTVKLQFQAEHVKFFTGSSSGYIGLLFREK